MHGHYAFNDHTKRGNRKILLSLELIDINIDLEACLAQADITTHLGGLNMKKCEDLDDVAEILGDNTPYGPNVNFNKVEELVDELVELGNSPKVCEHHDDHRGLKSKLSQKFLKSTIEELDTEIFESEINKVLEQANIIIPIAGLQKPEDKFN